MTVLVSKPAINIREQLTELKAQQGYEERQFHFDNLVTNGTFDTDVSGWSASTQFPPASFVWSSGAMVLTGSGATYSGANHPVSCIVGKTYVVSADITGSGYLSSSNSQAGWSPTSNITSFTATATTMYIVTATGGSNVATFDNVSVYISDGTDVVFTMPKSWKPLHVYEDGVLQREGSAHDYEVTYDGFDYSVKPVIAPSATTQTCVIGVRA